MGNTMILKVLVGSRAHGLATEQSDYDWHGVFVTPTTDILKIGGHSDQTSWIEDKQDDVSWEIGKFLLMATKCNPTVLEVFKAKQLKFMGAQEQREDKLGRELQELFPHIWNSVDVKNAFVGYGLNQRKKFFDDKDKRKNKYACAYLRTLYMAYELLTTGNMTVDMTNSPIYETLKDYKSGNFVDGQVIQTCLDWEDNVNKAFENNPDKKTNLEPINEFLLKIRKEYWL